MHPIGQAAAWRKIVVMVTSNFVGCLVKIARPAFVSIRNRDIELCGL